MFGTSFFGILNVSDSIGYLFRFGFGFSSDNTHNSKYHKTRFIQYLCWILIGSDSFLSDRVRFGFPDSVHLPSHNCEAVADQISKGLSITLIASLLLQLPSHNDTAPYHILLRALINGGK